MTENEQGEPGAGAAQLHPQMLVNAYCIDLAFGTAYAWVYLARCGATAQEIEHVLRATGPRCHDMTDDIFETAQRALQSVGLR